METFTGTWTAPLAGMDTTPLGSVNTDGVSAAMSRTSTGTAP
jgi:hypothetical protein